MRRIHKPKNSCPSWLAPAFVRADLLAIARLGGRTLVKESVYAFPYVDSEGKRASYTRDALNVFYHYKCCYCEKFCRADIEHYRPAGSNSGISPHNGYPWLCYEWSNLLPACPDCNGRSGKLSKFPILGTRVTLPHPNWLPKRNLNISFHRAKSHYLKSEDAYLLHPEIDDPNIYLAFRPHPQLAGFQLYGIDTAGRGNKTIEICFLNRQDLLSERLDILKNMRQAIKRAFQGFNLGHIPIQSFPKSLKLLFEEWESESKDVRLAHTLLRQFVIANEANLSLLLIPLLPHNQQAVILGYFRAFKLGTL